jgi:hypothetical protein
VLVNLLNKRKMEKYTFEIVNKTAKCKLLIADGFVFNKNKGKDEKYWRCKETSCKSCGKVVGKFFIYSNSIHHHPRNSFVGEKVKAVNEMKHLISSGHVKPRSAFDIIRAKLV